MAGIRFEMTDPEALQRYIELAEAIVEARGVCDGETLRLLEVKAKQLSVHQLDVEVVIDQLLGTINPVTGGEVRPSEHHYQLAAGMEVVRDLAGRLLWSKNADMGRGLVYRERAGEIIAELNSSIYAGSSAWRMPTMEEFEALFLTAGVIGEPVEHIALQRFATAGFTGVQPGWYWTGCQYEDMEYSFIANPGSGQGGYGMASNRYRLWLVSEKQ